MNKKQRATLRRIFSTPTPTDIPWTDILSLLPALGATIGQGRGSRIHVILNGQKAAFHAPHPRRQAPQARVRAIRSVLESAGVRP